MTDSMTPRERAEQIQRWLDEDDHWSFPDDVLPPGCIILTAEEAEQVRVSLDLAGAVFTSDEAPTLAQALALLQEDR